MVEISASEHTPLMEQQPPLPQQLSGRSAGRFPKSRTISLLQSISSRNDASQSHDTSHNAGVASVLKDIEEESEKDIRFFCFALLAIAGHIIGGSITMHYLEKWSFYDAMYFCIVTTTTVGYGDIIPTTALSKLYIIYYVIFSIGIISALLAYIVGLLLDQQEEMILEVTVGNGGNSITNSDVEAHLTAEESQQRILNATRSLDISDYYNLAFSTFTLLFLLTLGFLSFVYLEDLNTIDALYATFISASTVGFGDFEPTTDVSKVLASVWLCFSTVAVGKVVADFTNAHVKSKQRAMTRRLLIASMTKDSLHMMDVDGDGQVDKFEFVTEMLVRTGKVERRDLNAILLRFNALDEDCSGQIESTELDSS